MGEQTGLGEVNDLPLLNAVETLQGRDGDKDDNSLLAVANFDLIKTQSQHASSRTEPWTASRPVPEVNCTQARSRVPPSKGRYLFAEVKILYFEQSFSDS